MSSLFFAGELRVRTGLLMHLLFINLFLCVSGFKFCFFWLGFSLKVFFFIKVFSKNRPGNWGMYRVFSGELSIQKSYLKSWLENISLNKKLKLPKQFLN